MSISGGGFGGLREPWGSRALSLCLGTKAEIAKPQGTVICACCSFSPAILSRIYSTQVFVFTALVKATKDLHIGPPHRARPRSYLLVLTLLCQLLWMLGVTPSPATLDFWRPRSPGCPLPLDVLGLLLPLTLEFRGPRGGVSVTVPILQVPWLRLSELIQPAHCGGLRQTQVITCQPRPCFTEPLKSGLGGACVHPSYS